MTWVLVVGAVLVPALVMWSVAPPQRMRARAWWVLGLLAVAGLYVLPSDPWLTVVAAALGIWWVRQPDDFLGRLGHFGMITVVASWTAIAATWYLVRAIPAADVGWILVGWGALAYGQAALMGWEWWGKQDGRHPHAWIGQRMYAGCWLAMMCCLLPLWVWPGLLVGLFLSGPSWLAVLALGAGSVVRWPWVWPYALSCLLGVLALFVMAKNGQVWGLKWLPRGDTLDTVRVRLRVWRLALKHFALEPGAWLIGFGPGTAGRATRRWNLRHFGLEALGNMHSEPVQVVYEFGALGAMGLGLFVWQIGLGLTWGDPWSAAAVAGLVIAGGSNLSGIIPLGVTFLVICARVVS
jgi:hypothetical protein